MPRCNTNTYADLYTTGGAIPINCIGDYQTKNA